MTKGLFYFNFWRGFCWEQSKIKKVQLLFQRINDTMFTCIAIFLAPQERFWFIYISYYSLVECWFFTVFSSQDSRCSLVHPLSCVLGEISTRHGPVSLTHGQLFTDSIIQLSGDNTGNTNQTKLNVWIQPQVKTFTMCFINFC